MFQYAGVQPMCKNQLIPRSSFDLSVGFRQGYILRPLFLNRSSCDLEKKLADLETSLILGNTFINSLFGTGDFVHLSGSFRQNVNTFERLL